MSETNHHDSFSEIRRRRTGRAPIVGHGEQVQNQVNKLGKGSSPTTNALKRFNERFPGLTPRT